MSIILRVRRKRTQEPTSDLAVAFKRPRISDPSAAGASENDSPAQRFRLASTVEDTEEETLIGLKKIIAGDRQSLAKPSKCSSSASLPVSRRTEERNNNGSISQDYCEPCLRLADVELSNVKESSGSRDPKTHSKPGAVDLRGVFRVEDLMDVTEHDLGEAGPSEPQGEWVYDLYTASWTSSATRNEVDDESLLEMEVREWREDELIPDGEKDGEEEGKIEDDEDSNDEDNWRNDYPEEEGEEEQSDESVSDYGIGEEGADSDF